MAEAHPIKFSVITPERVVLEQRADFVAFTAHDGEMGVLHDRAPLMCELGIGELRYKLGADTQRIFIDGGFAQVNADEVSVLTPHAFRPAEITPEVIAESERAVGAVTGTDAAAMHARQQAQQRLRVLRDIQAPAAASKHA